MGKASLALDITRHVAVELHKPVGVFSLEMRADALGSKLLSAESEIAARCPRRSALKPVLARPCTAVRRIAGARLGGIRKPGEDHPVPPVLLWSKYGLPHVEGVTRDGLPQPL